MQSVTVCVKLHQPPSRWKPSSFVPPRRQRNPFKCRNAISLSGGWREECLNLCHFSKKDLWNLYNYLHIPVYFYPTVKMRVNSAECPLADPWRGERFIEILVWVLSLWQGKSTWWEAFLSCSLGFSLLQILRTCWGYCGDGAGCFRGAGRQEGLPTGGGDGGRSSTSPRVKLPLRHWGNISTQNRQIFLHVWSSRWVETENDGLNEEKGLPE